MADVLTPVAEAIFAFLALATYGTEDRPRHSLCRARDRADSMAARVDSPFGPNAFSYLVVFTGELYLGSVRIAWAILSISLLILRIVIFRWDSL